MYGPENRKYVCLMDLAVMGAKKLKKDGILTDQEETDEINACSIIVPVEIDGKTQEWLIQFKNETHNHPTEIEPFGGAATCLGGRRCRAGFRRRSWSGKLPAATAPTGTRSAWPPDL